jgi:hypothetical protein
MRERYLRQQQKKKGERKEEEEPSVITHAAPIVCDHKDSNVFE